MYGRPSTVYTAADITQTQSINWQRYLKNREIPTSTCAGGVVHEISPTTPQQHKVHLLAAAAAVTVTNILDVLAGAPANTSRYWIIRRAAAAAIRPIDKTRQETRSGRKALGCLASQGRNVASILRPHTSSSYSQPLWRGWLWTMYV